MCAALLRINLLKTLRCKFILDRQRKNKKAVWKSKNKTNAGWLYRVVLKPKVNFAGKWPISILITTVKLVRESD
jgi:hypothetical protein